MVKRNESSKVNIAGIFIGVLVILLLGGYFGIAAYYRNTYPVGTFVNGIYCTGMSAEEAASLLNRQYSFMGAKVKLGNSAVLELQPGDVTVTADYGPALAGTHSFAYSLAWPKMMYQVIKTGGVFLEAKPVLKVDQTRLSAWFYDQPAVKESVDTEHLIRLEYEEKTGYSLYNTKVHVLKDKDCLSFIGSLLEAGENRIELSEEQIYEDLEPTPEEAEVIRTFGEILAKTDLTVTYHMSDVDEVADQAVLSSLLMTDQDDPCILLRNEEGNIEFDDDKIAEYISRLGGIYDTYGKEQNYVTCNGEAVTIEGGNFGNLLDQEAEIAFLTEALEAGVNAERTPEYAKEGNIRGIADLGLDYIEINITTQTMYCIRDGKIWLTTDVVTGDVSKRRETPKGAYDIYFKQRNRVLHGGEVPVRVQYWMAVNRGVGIHDANWRKAFGEDIYIKNGSHGCINTPTDAVSQMYEYYPVGTPVLIYELDQDA